MSVVVKLELELPEGIEPSLVGLEHPHLPQREHHENGGKGWS